MGRDIYGRKDKLRSVSQSSSAVTCTSHAFSRAECVFCHKGVPQDAKQLEGMSGCELVPLGSRTPLKICGWGNVGAG